MDPKMIEINNLRVLNDCLNQTIDLLSRGQHLGAAPYGAGFPHSPYGAGFSHSPYGAGFPAGTDVVYGAQPYPVAGSPFGGGFPHPHTPFAGVNPFGGFYPAGFQGFGPGYSAPVDPFLAQRGIAAGGQFGTWQQPWGQFGEASRQAQLTQALCARQSVLEAMCRCAGIPV